VAPTRVRCYYSSRSENVPERDDVSAADAAAAAAKYLRRYDSVRAAVVAAPGLG